MVQSLETVSLDGHFARFIAGLAKSAGEEVFLAALLSSLATRNGDSCIHLDDWAGRQLELSDGRIFAAPGLEGWRRALLNSPVVGVDGLAAPLVLEDDRLYLSRYWEYEEQVAGFLRRLGEAEDCFLEPGPVAESLCRLFPPGNRDAGPDWQRLAGLAALLRPLAVITGGPGTGKTTTVALILALLGEQYRLRGQAFRVALVAPTGKAAMRLQESVATLKEAGRLPPASRELVPDRVMTIHRLLGVVSGSPHFRHNRDKPLPYDLLVVDEASMVDLPLMAKLLEALPSSARLILLGDRHQLASVEPGSVLGDICNPSGLAAFSRDFTAVARSFAEPLADSPGLTGPGRLCDSLIELRSSRRFAAGSGIALLSRAVRDGDFAGAWECLQDPAWPEVNWREVTTGAQLESWLGELVASGCFAWLSGGRPEQILAANNNFRVLCALRQGRFGAEQVSRRLRELLSALAPGRKTIDFPALPVMILRNDYDLQLYNGDTGVIWPGSGAVESRAYFPGPAGTLRAVAPSRLPEYQAAYAMTVHKSQGSEFAGIALVLPEEFSPVLSRELLFTAITRAREQVTICGTPRILAQAVAAVTERRSGLRQKLWG